MTKTSALALSATILFVIIAPVACIPVHLSIESDAASTPIVRIRGRTLRMSTSESPARRAIEVLDRSTPGQRVELARPVPVASVPICDEDFRVREGFVATPDGERLVSAGEGSRLAFEGRFRELQLTFFGSPHGGVVRVVVDGKPFDVDLARQDEAAIGFAIPPRRLLWNRTFVLSRLPHAIGVAHSGPVGSAMRVQLHTGPVTIASIDIPARGSRTVAVPSRMRVARALFAANRGLAVIVGLVIAIALGAIAIGYLVVRRARTHWADARSLVLAFATGLSLVALVSNSLAYAAGARARAPFDRVALAMLVVLGIGCAVRDSRKQTESSGPPTKTVVPTAVVVATILGACATFWPVIVRGLAYIGMLHTDSYFYTNVSEAIESASLFELDSYIGRGMRSIDLALAAELAATFDVTTNEVWIALPLVFMLALPFAAFFLVSDWLEDTRVATWSAVFVAIAPALSGLYLEAYLAQFLLSPLLVFSTLAASELLRSRELSRDNPALVSFVPLAATTVFAFLLYPHFALGLGFGVLVAVGSFASGLRAALGRFARFAALALGLANVGVTSLTNLGVAAEFEADLNEIARYGVFPFYAKARFAAIIANLAPFHADRRTLDRVEHEFVSRNTYRFFEAFVRGVKHDRIALVVALVAFVVAAIVLLRRKRVLANRTGWILLALVPQYAILAVAAWHTSGLYAVCKVMWTIATIVPIVAMPLLLDAAFVRDARGGRSATALRIVAGLVATVLAFAATTSKVFEMTPWLRDPRGAPGVPASGSADLMRLDAWRRDARMHDRRFELELAPGTPPEQGLDVLAGQTFGLLESAGWECENEYVMPKLLSYLATTPRAEPPAGPPVVVSIGDPDRDLGPEFRRTLRGNALVVFVRRATP